VEVDQEEVIRRAAHLALEHFTHDLEGGEIILRKGRKRERLRFDV